jgi:two-component system sensor histidine kinase UhpB
MVGLDGTLGTNGVPKRAERLVSPKGRRPTVPTVTEQVAELEAYRVGARALAARIITAQEAERVRVSRELHDDTGQALTLLLVRLQLVEGMSSEPEVQRELADLRELVGQTLDGVRRLAVHLGPSVLEDLGLCAGLEWLADRVRAETRLVVDLRLDCDGSHASPEVAVAIFRVAQEALTNAVRHAHATRVDVRLGTNGSSLALSIADDGSGFDVAQAQARPTASVGLFGMAERIALVGGDLDIDSSPGGGTRIRVSVPLREEVLA